MDTYVCSRWRTGRNNSLSIGHIFGHWPPFCNCIDPCRRCSWSRDCHQHRIRTIGILRLPPDSNIRWHICHMRVQWHLVDTSNYPYCDCMFFPSIRLDCSGILWIAKETFNTKCRKWRWPFSYFKKHMVVEGFAKLPNNELHELHQIQVCQRRATTLSSTMIIENRFKSTHNNSIHSLIKELHIITLLSYLLENNK